MIPLKDENPVNNKSYIRSSYEESLNTQALIEAAIKSQNSNKMELAEKI